MEDVTSSRQYEVARSGIRGVKPPLPYYNASFIVMNLKTYPETCCWVGDKLTIHW
jgi:hypothetical protein